MISNRCLVCPAGAMVPCTCPSPSRSTTTDMPHKNFEDGIYMVYGDRTTGNRFLEWQDGKRGFSLLVPPSFTSIIPSVTARLCPFTGHETQQVGLSSSTRAILIGAYPVAFKEDPGCRLVFPECSKQHVSWSQSRCPDGGQKGGEGR